MKFCLRKEHRRLQGIIYGKRCGIPKTLAQRRENGGRITSLLLRCPLSAKGDSSLQLFELVSPTRKVIHHAIHAVVSGDVVARRQDRIVDTAGEDHAADECRYACMSGPYVARVIPPPKPDGYDLTINPNGTVSYSAGFSVFDWAEARRKKRDREGVYG